MKRIDTALSIVLTLRFSVLGLSTQLPLSCRAGAHLAHRPRYTAPPPRSPFHVTTMASLSDATRCAPQPYRPPPSSTAATCAATAAASATEGKEGLAEVKARLRADVAERAESAVKAAIEAQNRSPPLKRGASSTAAAAAATAAAAAAASILHSSTRRKPLSLPPSLPSSGPTTNAEDQAEAAALQEAGQAAAAADAGAEGEGGADEGGTAPPTSAALEAFSAVLISENDTYKYVLIKAKDPATNAYKFLVRGKSGANYHKDAAR